MMARFSPPVFDDSLSAVLPICRKLDELSRGESLIVWQGTDFASCRVTTSAKKEYGMSSTYLINQRVAEQRHASEQQGQSRGIQQRGKAGFDGHAQQNVGQGERTISLLSGAILAGLGLTRGGLSGLAMIGMGGALAYRGATGHCSVYQSLGIDSTKS
jgi:hypothetical protein